MLKKLKETNEGCHIGSICANAFAYADDIVLLSPSCTAIRNLVNICETYANEYDIKFNPDKCTLLIFSKLEHIENDVNIIIYGSKVSNISNEKHLGHVFDSNFTHSLNLINIDNVIRDMKVRTYTISTQFKQVSWRSKTVLFNSQCLSLYSCQLWRLDDPKVDQLCTTWKVCCRKLLNLNQRTRSRFIHQLMRSSPLLDIIMYRMLSFFLAGLNNEDDLISYFFRNTLLSNTSYMKVNINKILEHFNIQYQDIFCLTKGNLKNKLNSLIDNKDWQLNLIEEILDMRDGIMIADFIDPDDDLKFAEIKHLLDQVSTDFLVN